MTTVSNLSLAPSPYIAPSFCELSCKEIIWDVVSIILFPIGLARVVGNLVGRYIIPLVLLPAASNPPPPDVVLNEGAEKIRVPTPDGEELDGLLIHTPGAKKWIVYANPNGEVWQGLYPGITLMEYPLLPPYFQSAVDAGYNVLCVNYRGTGNSTGHAGTFDNLFCDVDSAVQYLTREENAKDPSEEVIMHGHSLGGASALEIGKRYGTKVIVQNTFLTPFAVAKDIVEENYFSF